MNPRLRLRAALLVGFLPGVPAWTWAVSVAVHVGLVGGAAWVALGHMKSDAPLAAVTPNPTMQAYTIDLPGVAEGSLLAPNEPDPAGDPPTPAGGSVVPRPDTQKVGRGGDARVPEPAVHLSDVDDQMRLSPDLVSRLDRDQVQRLRSAKRRSAWEDRRATPNPTELTFLASGKGERAERRPVAPSDPSRGAAASPAAVARGGNVGSTEQTDGPEGERGRIGAAHEGSLETSPGVGVTSVRPGSDHRFAAAVMHARPDITQGPVTVPAQDKKRPNDIVDSEQEVSTIVRSLVHASTSGGRAGEGRGGSEAAGDPGAGGAHGVGSHPQPLGRGDGDWFELDTHDPRLLPYFRRIQAKVHPLWADAFPKSAMLELKQGTVIIEFTIAADGNVTVHWPPLRPSGIDEFDRNCANAIRRAAPFDAIPKELGRSTLRIRAPFIANNPVVR